MRDMARPVKEKENALPPEGMEVDTKADVKGAKGKKSFPADEGEPSKREPPAYRAGFLLGDGAGMGKGRTLAGFVVENIARGRKKHVWISVSSDLYEGEYPSLAVDKVCSNPIRRFLTICTLIIHTPLQHLTQMLSVIYVTWAWDHTPRTTASTSESSHTAASLAPRPSPRRRRAAREARKPRPTLETTTKASCLQRTTPSSGRVEVALVWNSW